MPSCSPFSSITRISRARMRSLMRIKDFAERLSSAMVLSSTMFERQVPDVLECCRTRERTLSIALVRVVPGGAGGGVYGLDDGLWNSFYAGMRRGYQVGRESVSVGGGGKSGE